MTLGHKTMVTSSAQVEKGSEPLDLTEWRNASGNSRRPSWSLGLQQLCLKYYKQEGFEVPHETRTLVLLS